MPKFPVKKLKSAIMYVANEMSQNMKINMFKVKKNRKRNSIIVGSNSKKLKPERLWHNILHLLFQNRISGINSVSSIMLKG